MATISWAPLPHPKIVRMCRESGQHLTHFVTDARTAGDAGAALHPTGRHDVARRRLNRGDITFGNVDGSAIGDGTVLTLTEDFDALPWDDVVDVVCAGTGSAPLASAIVLADAGRDVFVACGPVSSHVDADLPARLGVDEGETETRDYLAAVTADLETPGPLRSRDMLRVATVVDESASRDVVPPFFGSALRTWARSCVASPTGVLYTNVVEKGLAAVSTEGDGEVQAAVIAPLNPATSALTLNDLLADQAGARDIEVDSASRLQRLVFDELGQVAGIVLADSEGVRAVRTLHGVVIASGIGSESDVPLAQLHSETRPARLCVMSRNASRFGQVGLLVDP